MSSVSLPEPSHLKVIFLCPVPGGCACRLLPEGPQDCCELIRDIQVQIMMQNVSLLFPFGGLSAQPARRSAHPSRPLPSFLFCFLVRMFHLLPTLSPNLGDPFLHPCLAMVGDVLLSFREEHLLARQISPVLLITFHTRLWHAVELKDPFPTWREDGIEQRGWREQRVALSHTPTHTQTHGHTHTLV